MKRPVINWKNIFGIRIKTRQISIIKVTNQYEKMWRTPTSSNDEVTVNGFIFPH